MRIRLLLSIVIWSLFGLVAAQAQIVVVNRSVKLAEIKKSDLRDIFMGTTSEFKDGSHAVPSTLKAGPVHEAFLKNYIGGTDAELQREWRKLLFAGQAMVPKSFEAEVALIDYVASTPGAIGYVGSSTDHEKVKALAVK
jgi:ABC-type phosphate transport system substrate-binding protein